MHYKLIFLGVKLVWGMYFQEMFCRLIAFLSSRVLRPDHSKWYFANFCHENDNIAISESVSKKQEKICTDSLITCDF